MNQKLNFTFKEGIGGGNRPNYLLMLNDGICKGYPKANFTRDQAKQLADEHVEENQHLFGKKNVTYKVEGETKMNTILDLINTATNLGIPIENITDVRFLSTPERTEHMVAFRLNPNMEFNLLPNNFRIQYVLEDQMGILDCTPQ